MTAPTPAMAAVMLAITKLTTDGVPPTYRQIMAETGIRSTGNLHQLLTRMRARGLVRWQDNCTRSLEVVAPAGGWARLERLSDVELHMLRVRIDVLLNERTS